MKFSKHFKDTMRIRHELINKDLKGKISNNDRVLLEGLELCLAHIRKVLFPQPEIPNV